MNTYHVAVRNKYTGDERSITVVTDTFRNAQAIGVAQCKANEEVYSVYTQAEGVVIDYAAIRDGNAKE